MAQENRLQNKHSILYLITRTEPGGAQTHLYELIRSFSADINLSLASGEKLWLASAAQDLGVPFHLIKSLVQPISLASDQAALKQFKAIYKRALPELAHFHSSKAGLLGRLAARNFQFKKIFTAHGWAFTDGTPFARKLLALVCEKYVGRFTDKIITVSDADYRLAMKYRIVPAHKLVRIHNGISDTSHRAAPERVDAFNGCVKIVFVSRLASPKDPLSLINAVANLKHLNLKVDVWGDGPMRGQLEKAIAYNGLENTVTLRGEADDIDQKVSESHVFVLLSKWEGLPISVIEALRAGLPVVASDVGGMRELVSSENGFLIPDSNSTLLTEAIEKLATQAQLRNELGRNSRLKYERSFTAELMLKETRKVYESVFCI